MKKLLVIIVLSLLWSGNTYSQNLKFTKIVNLDDPWGFSFINDYELIISKLRHEVKSLTNSNNECKNEMGKF